MSCGRGALEVLILNEVTRADQVARGRLQEREDQRDLTSGDWGR